MIKTPNYEIDTIAIYSQKETYSKCKTAIHAKNRRNYFIGYGHLSLLLTLKVYDAFKYVHQVISKQHLFTN